jgi:hypothetical protein
MGYKFKQSAQIIAGYQIPYSWVKNFIKRQEEKENNKDNDNEEKADSEEEKADIEEKEKEDNDNKDNDNKEKEDNDNKEKSDDWDEYDNNENERYLEHYFQIDNVRIFDTEDRWYSEEKNDYIVLLNAQCLCEFSTFSDRETAHKIRYHEYDSEDFILRSKYEEIYKILRHHLNRDISKLILDTMIPPKQHRLQNIINQLAGKLGRFDFTVSQCGILY